jgi:hypothetical protein
MRICPALVKVDGRQPVRKRRSVKKGVVLFVILITSIVGLRLFRAGIEQVSIGFDALR